MKTTKRVLALILGGLFGYVQLAEIPKLPAPVNGEAFGFDAAWVVILGGSVLLLAYGVGLYPRAKKEPTSSGS